jgi:uncharacterized integral membrane protein
MTKLVRWLVSLVAIILIAAFAVSNRQQIDVALAPLPGSVPLPVYIVFLGGLVLGAVIGAMATWLGGWRRRRDSRRMRKQIWSLETKLGVVERQQQQAAEANRQAARSTALQRVG